MVQLEEFPQIRAQRAAEQEALSQESEVKKARLAEIEKKRRDLEGSVEMTENRLKEFQGKLNQIKTNKEYQAAMKEVADTKRENKQTEDQILQIMTEVETVKKGATEAEEKLKVLLPEREREEAEMKATEEALQKEIVTLEAGRQECLQGIDPGVLAQYDKVRKVRPEAVAFVIAGACLGCRMRIPPQLVIEIRKLRAVHTCPSCFRILYLEET